MFRQKKLIGQVEESTALDLAFFGTRATKNRTDRLVLVNSFDRFGQDWSDRQHFHIGQSFFIGNRITVGHNNTVDRRGAKPFDSRPGENAMRCGHVNLFGALFLDQFSGTTY